MFGNILWVDCSLLAARSCSFFNKVSQSSATMRISWFSPYTNPSLTAFWIWNEIQGHVNIFLKTEQGGLLAWLMPFIYVPYLANEPIMKLIKPQTPKGQSQVSALQKCLFYCQTFLNMDTTESELSICIKEVSNSTKVGSVWRLTSVGPIDLSLTQKCSQGQDRLYGLAHHEFLCIPVIRVQDHPDTDVMFICYGWLSDKTTRRAQCST